MRKRFAAVTIGAAAVLVWIAVPSGQDVRSVPGPGTGVVSVTGTVDIGNTPSMKAIQGGEWKVALANTADVRVTNTATVTAAPREFLKVGRRYSVTWPAGQSETVVVVQLGSGGWTRVELTGASGRRRWINLDVAQSVEELDVSGSTSRTP